MKNSRIKSLQLSNSQPSLDLFLISSQSKTQLQQVQQINTELSLLKSFSHRIQHNSFSYRFTSTIQCNIQALGRILKNKNYIYKKQLKKTHQPILGTQLKQQLKQKGNQKLNSLYSTFYNLQKQYSRIYSHQVSENKFFKYTLDYQTATSSQKISYFNQLVKQPTFWIKQQNKELKAQFIERIQSYYKITLQNEAQINIESLLIHLKDLNQKFQELLRLYYLYKHQPSEVLYIDLANVEEQFQNKPQQHIIFLMMMVNLVQQSGNVRQGEQFEPLKILLIEKVMSFLIKKDQKTLNNLLPFLPSYLNVLIGKNNINIRSHQYKSLFNVDSKSQLGQNQLKRILEFQLQPENQFQLFDLKNCNDIDQKFKSMHLSHYTRRTSSVSLIFKDFSNLQKEKNPTQIYLELLKELCLFKKAIFERSYKTLKQCIKEFLDQVKRNNIKKAIIENKQSNQQKRKTIRSLYQEYLDTVFQAYLVLKFAKKSQIHFSQVQLIYQAQKIQYHQTYQ